MYMSKQKLKTALVSIVLLSFGAACGGLAEENEQPDPLAEQNKHIEEYNELTKETNEHREEFLGEVADRTRAVGNRLFWQEIRSDYPVLHSKDFESGEEVQYGFKIGKVESSNYSAGSKLVVHANTEISGDEVHYMAWKVGAEKAKVGELVLKAPKSEAKWWSYDVDGSSVYIAKKEGDDYALEKWTPGEGAQTETVVMLEKASGKEIGEFWTVSIDDDHAIYVESGRVWHLDMGKKKATWVGNETEVLNGMYDDEGAYMAQEEGGSGAGLYFFPYGGGDSVSISKGIEESGYEMNETFDSAHRFSGDGEQFFLWKSTIVYVGSSGVFAYGMNDGRVSPLLIEPRPEVSQGVRIEYRYPTVLDNGMLFVTGLASESGSVGADGPIYRVDLTDYEDLPK